MSEPRPYDLSDPAEIRRLIGELRGYMRVSLKDGTDEAGRAHAYAALCSLDTWAGLAAAFHSLAEEAAAADLAAMHARSDPMRSAEAAD